MGALGRGRRWLPLLLAALSFGAHLAVGVLYAASGLLAPAWAVIVLGLWWFVLCGLGLRLAARRSLWVVAVPILAAISWVAVITAGEEFGHWSA